MPTRLPVLSWKEVIKALGKAGFRPVRQRGSHIILEGSEGRKFTVVPRHDEIAPTTLVKILAEAGLTREQFLELL
ncbi:MAG: type II toxin-antitoxin system HicA family toxin [Nitrososphaerales archaeon]